MADDEEPRSDNPSRAVDDRQQQSTGSANDERSSLFNKANQFLQDVEVKDAPRERKEEFLQSKGFTDLDIDSLLKGTGETPLAPGTRTPEEPSGAHLDAGQSSTSPPPIITYPEFLLHSQKLPPLITIQRLLTATYVVSGATAIAYGTGEYLVKPMLESLGLSRHSLCDTASTNLRTLIAKLGNHVSVTPPSAAIGHDTEQIDSESVSSHGAHFFSRNIATQTSPEISRSPSPSIKPPQPPSLDAQQLTSLSNLKQSLEDIRSKEDSEQSVQESIVDLRNLLNQLPHLTDPAVALKGSSSWSQQSGSDGVAKVKGEIKSVKGVVLSARNFPSSIVR